MIVEPPCLEGVIDKMVQDKAICWYFYNIGILQQDSIPLLPLYV